MTPETLKEIHAEYLNLRDVEKLQRERTAKLYAAYLETQGLANETQRQGDALYQVLCRFAPDLLNEKTPETDPQADVFADIEETEAVFVSELSEQPTKDGLYLCYECGEQIRFVVSEQRSTGRKFHPECVAAYEEKTTEEERDLQREMDRLPR